jgi:hypothetical protein
LITGATVVTEAWGTLDAGGSALGGVVSKGNGPVAVGDAGAVLLRRVWPVARMLHADLFALFKWCPRQDSNLRHRL